MQTITQLPFVRSKGFRNLALALVIAIMFFPAASARAQAPLPDCQVLAVGVDAYSAESKQKSLKGCKNDAVNLSNRINDQAGKLFANVNQQVLSNEQATLANIQKSMAGLRGKGKAGDWVVLVLSGHGGTRPDGRWTFVPSDGRELVDTYLLDWANALAGQGKKVWVIIDACHVGQLRLNARELLERYQNPQGGGIILMLATVPKQESQSLGKFSSYAQAVNEALAGDADFDRNGVVTLRELRHFAYNRTVELTREFKAPAHDGECVYSLSISDSQPLAVVRSKAILRSNADLTAKDPLDTARKGCYRKVYTVQMQAGATYTIDLKSSDFDTYLRLTDSQGKSLSENDDIGGNNLNSRIVYRAATAGTYHVVVTSCFPSKTGAFTLAVKQGQ